MLQVSCDEIGVKGCPFVAHGERQSTVEARMFEHIRSVHPWLVTGQTFEQRRELRRTIVAKMHAGESAGEPGQGGRRLIGRWLVRRL
jgi:predicted small metal-binding protein